MSSWHDSRFTGLFLRLGLLPLRPHDPYMPTWSGTLPPWGPRSHELTVGGAGWDSTAAEAACVGEALERLQPYPLPRDQILWASFRSWPLDEPALEPERWVLFHPEQYAQPDFPFLPFTRSSDCRWICFRRAGSGDPCWVPEELAYLYSRAGIKHSICPGVSTGLSCGRVGDPVLVRGLQEVIERDAVVGAWWGSYLLEEWDQGPVLTLVGPEIAQRILRPNLRYRFYRVDGAFSDHVTIVTVEGEDLEGYCFSAGSACRETRSAAWNKAILEAVHGRFFVRFLLKTFRDRNSTGLIQEPADFSEHALYYSHHRQELDRTVLHHAIQPVSFENNEQPEGFLALVERLGPNRPVLFRNMTAPGVAQEHPEWYVLKVVVPGLQPLHGVHRLAHLGGKLWAPRGLAEWSSMCPHPFP